MNDITWEELFQEYRHRGWHVWSSDQWVEVEISAPGTDHLGVFRKDDADDLA